MGKGCAFVVLEGGNWNGTWRDGSTVAGLMGLRFTFGSVVRRSFCCNLTKLLAKPFFSSASLSCDLIFSKNEIPY